jgi:hypothetical protein
MNNDNNETPAERKARLNRERQKKHYDANRVAIIEAKKAKRIAKREQQTTPAPETVVTPEVTPEIIADLQRQLDECRDEHKTETEPAPVCECEKQKKTKKTLSTSKPISVHIPPVEPTPVAPVEVVAPAEESAPLKKNKYVKSGDRTFKLSAFDKDAIMTKFDAITGKKPKTIETHKNQINNVFRFCGCDNLYECLKNFDKAKPAILNGKKKNGEEYELNAKKMTFESITFSIDHFNVPILPATRVKWVNFFETFKIKSKKQTEARKEDPNFAVLPMNAYMEKILEKFGIDSKEYLIVTMYNELTCRDDYTVKIIKNKKEMTNKIDNYLIVPKTKKSNVTVVLHSYKTDKKYGVIECEFSPPASAIVRKYIIKKELPYDGFLFPETNNGLAGFISEMNPKIGEKGGVSYIRKSKISQELSNEDITDEERVELASKMMHSPIAQLAYVRLLKD